MVKLNIAKLREILESFYELTGIKASIHSVDFQELLFCPEKYANEFCRAMSLSADSVSLCSKADKERFERVRETGKPETTICPFGLVEAFAPIVIDGNVVCFIVLGQNVRADADIDAMTAKAAHCGHDPKVIREILEKTPKIQERMLKAATVILDACARYVCVDKYVDVAQGDLIASIHDYIVEHLSEKLTVDVLCKRFYLSRGTLYATFEDQLNISVADYIRNERLLQSVTLLEHSDHSIKEIASLVGLDYNYFSKIFFKRYKTTPKKYALAHKKTWRKER